MPTARITFSVSLPGWLHSSLRKANRMLMPPYKRPEARVNLWGDRDIEWSYIASRLPMGSGDVFDFGCGFGNMSIHAVQKGYHVLALDLLPNLFPWSHPNVEIVCADLLRMDLPKRKFDYVLNCSTVEHVGLSGRYGVSVEETDGDLAAMQILRELLKPTGKVLMTIPCGLDAVIVPYHRVYGKQRLPILLDGFEVEEEIYWAKRTDNRWYPAEREAALAYLPTSHPTEGALCSYALGCFVLRKHNG